MKNIKYGENKHNRTRSSIFIHTKIRLVLFLHIHASLGMMLAQDYASCHRAKSTLVMFVANNVQKLRWPAKILDLNPIDHVLDLLKHKARAQPLQLNLRELMCVIYQMSAPIHKQ